MAADTEKASPTRRINRSVLHQCVLFIPLGIIKVYRLLISPLLGNQCRFYPSCSHYSEQALERFGLLKGSFLTIKRLLKCHPWHSGGIDPVPDNSSDNHSINCNHN